MYKTINNPDWRLVVPNYVCMYGTFYLCVPLFPTYTTYTTTITTTIIACSIFFTAYKLFQSNNTYSLGLYSGDLQTTTVLFTQRVFTQDWLNYYYSQSTLSCLMNVLEVKCLCSRFLENSIATSLLFVDCVNIACCCFHLSFPFSLTLLLWVYLCSKLVAIVGIGFINNIHVKPWYTPFPAHFD